MLTRTPPASRFLQSQPWGPSIAAVSFFTTSATTHEQRKPLPSLPNAKGWDELPDIIPRRSSSNPGEIKPLQRSGYPPSASTSSTSSTSLRPPVKHDPHARSEIIKEMKAFIWEKISAEAAAAAAEAETEASDEQQQEISYKLARDPTLPASPNIYTPKLPTKLKLPPGMPTEIHRWLHSAHSQPETAEIYNGPTLLLLTAAPKNLLESDFYRLARQGAHLENWAVGLVRVVQAREPGTHEPAGRYYVFFETRTAAMAYEEEVSRLHSLARRRLADTEKPRKDPMAMTAKEKDDEERLRGFTLVPAGAKLEIKLWLGKDVEMGDGKEWERGEINSRLLFRPGGEEIKIVLVSLEGAMSTVDALRDAIERDAAERKVPWRRAEGGVDIRAVEAGGDAVLVEEGNGLLAAEQRDGKNEEEAAVKRNQRFSRFVLPFADENEVRRFVRHWHRREFPDFEGRDMTVTVNATAIW